MYSKNRSERPYLARLAIVLILPVALTVYATTFYATVDDLGLASKLYPQALIFVLVPAMASLAWSDVREWIQADAHPKMRETWNRWKRSAMTAAWTAVFIWAIEQVGFYEAVVLYLIVLMPLLGVRRTPVIAAYTAGTVLGLYLLFDLTLRVRLPEGLLIG